MLCWNSFLRELIIFTFHPLTVPKSAANAWVRPWVRLERRNFNRRVTYPPGAFDFEFVWSTRKRRAIVHNQRPVVLESRQFLQLWSLLPTSGVVLSFGVWCESCLIKAVHREILLLCFTTQPKKHVCLPSEIWCIQETRFAFRNID